MSTATTEASKDAIFVNIHSSGDSYAVCYSSYFTDDQNSLLPISKSDQFTQGLSSILRKFLFETEKVSETGCHSHNNEGLISVLENCMLGSNTVR